MTSTALTVKQARFCDEYVVCGNAAAAARAAGYRERSARQIGFENLTKPDIQIAIQARQQAHADALELTRQDVLKALLGAIQAAQEAGKPAVMISGWKELSRLCGFYEPEIQRVDPLTTEAELIRRKIEALPTNALLELAVKKRGLLEAATQ